MIEVGKDQEPKMGMHFTGSRVAGLTNIWPVCPDHPVTIKASQLMEKGMGG